ncbi:50S ribosomal protein L6 [Candidatus Uhrbacteria bacterium]|nr:50S ribosomal protein L6 [Candidatus Uhrbacteria bacterium]
MSRVGKKPLSIPDRVEISKDGEAIRVKGPKGELSVSGHPRVNVDIEGNTLTVGVKDTENVHDRALWGLYRRLIGNMVTGVTEGFEKKLEINGVGYKAAVSGNVLKLDVGFSHPVDFTVPTGIEISVEKNVITVRGIDKQAVGEVAAGIRRIRKPEPYKGKGIKYVDETIRRKAGKAAKAGD